MGDHLRFGEGKLGKHGLRVARRSRDAPELPIGTAPYASGAAKETDWAAVPNRTGRLREVYWARRAESKSGRNGRLDRSAIVRRTKRAGHRLARPECTAYAIPIIAPTTTPSIAKRVRDTSTRMGL